MPQCTFLCWACKKEFSIILILSEYEAVKKPNWLVFRAFFGD